MASVNNSDNVSPVKILIKNGGNVDAESVGGWTPLHLSVHFGNGKVTKALIENGANVNATSTEQRRSALHLVSENGKCIHNCSMKKLFLLNYT